MPLHDKHFRFLLNFGPANSWIGMSMSLFFLCPGSHLGTLGWKSSLLNSRIFWTELHISTKSASSQYKPEYVCTAHFLQHICYKQNKYKHLVSIIIWFNQKSCLPFTSIVCFFYYEASKKSYTFLITLFAIFFLLSMKDQIIVYPSKCR